jgi:hypothetical protein
MSKVKNYCSVAPGGTILAVLVILALFLCQTAAAETVEGFNYSTIEVEPLTLQDCARCHTAHYNWLKDNGARHQTVACTEWLSP